MGISTPPRTFSTAMNLELKFSSRKQSTNMLGDGPTAGIVEQKALPVAGLKLTHATPNNR
jgi:hypothetical protein